MKKLGSAVLSLALLMGVCMTGCQNSSGSSQATAAATADEAATADSASYSQDLFDTSYVHEMNVELSEEDWKDLLANPLKKTKYTAAVTIDGNKVKMYPLPQRATPPFLRSRHPTPTVTALKSISAKT